MIAKSRLHRETCQRAQVGVGLLEIHALEAPCFLGGQLDRSGALDEDFPSFTLRVLEAEKRSVGFRVADGFFHGDEELVAALRGAGDFQGQDA